MRFHARHRRYARDVDHKLGIHYATVRRYLQTIGKPIS